MCYDTRCSDNSPVAVGEVSCEMVMRYPDILADAHDEGYLFFLEKLDDIFRPGEPSVKNEHRFLRCERQSAVYTPWQKS